MYGYVVPLKAELKVREYEHYKAAYCGLCHTLGRKYGVVARFLVNYDFTLLSIVLDGMSGEPCKYEKKRCIASPHKRKCICSKSRSQEFTAAATVILAYWKIKDNIEDNSFFKGLPYRFLKLLNTRAYKKAKGDLEWFDKAVNESISKLHAIEEKRKQGIDAAADTFAELMASISGYFEDDVKRRISREVFYHVGRVIYILDAFYDVEEDEKNQNYNPIVLTGLSDEEITTTINCSLNAAINAWSLIDENPLTDLVLNVLTLGIPSVVKEKEKKNERSV
ncbi:MAG: hypothetical protein IKU84_05555 [Clostridia bacterium]|nr:hypothetical protein [Clostridia bacterium]